MPTINKSIQYSFVIITQKRSKNIFNCSNNVNTKKSSLIKTCSEYKQFQDQQKSIIDEIKNHFSCNINPEILNKQKTDYVSIRYSISSIGMF